MTDLTQPHEAAPDEDPEVHIGQEVPDPWEGMAFAAEGPLSPQAFGVIAGTTLEQAAARQAQGDLPIGWGEPNSDPPDWPLWFGGSQPSEDPRDSWPGY